MYCKGYLVFQIAIIGESFMRYVLSIFWINIFWKTGVHCWSQADHPLLVGAVVDWNLSNDLLLFIEEIHVNNTVAIICYRMQNLKQIFQ